jgi:hypothetical protein
MVTAMIIMARGFNIFAKTAATLGQKCLIPNPICGHNIFLMSKLGNSENYILREEEQQIRQPKLQYCRKALGWSYQ